MSLLYSCSTALRRGVLARSTAALPPACSVPLSSAPAPEATAAAKARAAQVYQNERVIWTKRVSEARKEYAAQEQARKDAAAALKTTQEAEIARKKEERMASRLARSVETAKRTAAERAANEAAFEERRAFTDSVRDSREALALRRRLAMVAFLEEEAKGWLTPARVDAEITEAFLATPGAVVGKSLERSPYWGYVAHVEDPAYLPGTGVDPIPPALRALLADAKPTAEEAREGAEAAAAADGDGRRKKGAPRPLRTRGEAVNLAHEVISGYASTYVEYKKLRESDEGGAIEEFIDVMQVKCAPATTGGHQFKMLLTRRKPVHTEINAPEEGSVLHSSCPFLLRGHMFLSASSTPPTLALSLSLFSLKTTELEDESQNVPGNFGGGSGVFARGARSFGARGGGRRLGDDPRGVSPFAFHSRQSRPLGGAGGAGQGMMAAGKPPLPRVEQADQDKQKVSESERMAGARLEGARSR